MDNRVEYRCRIALEQELINVALIKFLKQKVNLSEKDKVIPALSAYWLPFALKADGNYSDSELKYYAKTAIYKLKLHIAFLCEAFALEDFSLIHPTNTNSKKKVQQAVLISPESSVNNESSSQAERLNSLEFVHHQDDNTFEEMFD
ncbi:MAG: hypothetical protein KME59_25430 [Trichormus sp. ATA11-4-KO1]|jgi:hypothetical protein|nr:hypothetical protein [Trichormus sp. ATA11-4-KO1]